MFCTVVLSKVVEGSINYWAVIRNRTLFREGDIGYESFEVRDAENESGPWLLVDGGVIVRGLDTLPLVFRGWPERLANIRQAILEKDALLLGAEDVDLIVQAGLFGDIVFG